MIHPTVGRVVWFFPSLHTGTSGFATPDEGQPLAAIIARVWSDRLVNLTVFDATGVAHSRTSVVLVQEGDGKPIGDRAEWMPYQVGQAKKHDTEAARAAEPKAVSLAPHQQRVVDEKVDLDDRTAKLNAFFEVPMFGRLDSAEQHRMRTQAVAMRTYSEILGERIAAFATVDHHPI